MVPHNASGNALYLTGAGNVIVSIDNNNNENYAFDLFWET
jgi:hypothetical protein